ncbi:unnamed protein product, partial [Rotaria sp. Silwood1]
GTKIENILKVVGTGVTDCYIAVIGGTISPGRVQYIKYVIIFIIHVIQNSTTTLQNPSSCSEYGLVMVENSILFNFQL